MTDGHCAGTSEVIFVDESANCTGASGTMAAPFCMLPDGVTALKAGQNVLVIIGPVGERLTLATPQINPVIVGRQKGTNGPKAEIGALNNAGISVMSDTVLIRDILVDSGSISTNTRGVLIKGTAAVTLLRVTVNLGNGIGVDAESGTALTMDECYVENNAAGGIVVNGATAKIQNTVIAAGTVTTGTGIQFTTPGTGTQFLFNTVVGYAIAATSDSSDSVPLIDSIVLGPTSNCPTTTSVTATPTALNATTYHLTGPVGCPSGGMATSVDHDIDGQSRPASGFDCGADEYVASGDGGS
jgi:hypothetical protein